MIWLLFIICIVITLSFFENFMSNLKEALIKDFLFLHGDKKYSKGAQICCV